MASEIAQEMPVNPQPAVVPDAADAPLPKLSPSEFRQYNRMAQHMDMFHNHFRQTWDQLYKASSPDTTSKLTASRIINLSQQFVQHLTLHHDIEEEHIFPVLAKRMPAFSPEAQEGMKAQHRLIHKGLDNLSDYIQEVRTGAKDFRREQLREILDGFGDVLWKHLDEEVKQLGAENMRRYWSLEDMATLPM